MGHFRTELKESSQVLADVLGAVAAPTPSTVTLTPQLIDDEMPVLHSSTNKSSSVVPSIRTVNSSLSSLHSSKTSSSYGRTPIPHSSSIPNHAHNSHSHAGNSVMHGTQTGGHSHSHTTVEEGMEAHSRHKQLARNVVGSKRRRWSGEQGPSVAM